MAVGTEVGRTQTDSQSCTPPLTPLSTIALPRAAMLLLLTLSLFSGFHIFGRELEHPAHLGYEGQRVAHRASRNTFPHA